VITVRMPHGFIWPMWLAGPGSAGLRNDYGEQGQENALLVVVWLGEDEVPAPVRISSGFHLPTLGVACPAVAVACRLMMNRMIAAFASRQTVLVQQLIDRRSELTRAFPELALAGGRCLAMAWPWRRTTLMESASPLACCACWAVRHPASNKAPITIRSRRRKRYGYRYQPGKGGGRWIRCRLQRTRVPLSLAASFRER
jgi:hypothetical protein